MIPLKQLDWPTHLKMGSFPFILGASTLLVGMLWGPLGLPPIETIMVYFKQWFALYGLWAVAICAFIEAIFMLGFYLPGSMAILAGVVVYAEDPVGLTRLLITCWAAFMLAAVVNYYMGQQGFYRILNWLGAEQAIVQAQNWFTKFGKVTFIVAAFHPNYLAMATVTAGTAQMPLKTVLFWCGLGMAISGPILGFISLYFARSIMQGQAGHYMFWLFVTLFFIWALFAIAHSAYQEHMQKA